MIHTNKPFVVYCHTNTIDNKKYIGITSQTLSQRARNGKGYKNCPRFYSAIKEFGWENFSCQILYENLGQQEAKEKEIELIEKFQTRDPKYGYNITPGGDKCSGADSPWYGKHHTEKSKALMSEKRKGVPKTEEWKRKISESNKGRIVSEETKEKMRKNHADVSGEKNPNYGKRLSKEMIEKLVAASKTPEAIEKMKKNKKWYSGAENPNAKKVICLETGKIFNTVNEAAKEMGCSPSKISSVCHGKRNHTRGLHFKIVED